jgi:hypothetical protein
MTVVLSFMLRLRQLNSSESKKFCLFSYAKVIGQHMTFFAASSIQSVRLIAENLILRELMQRPSVLGSQPRTPRQEGQLQLPRLYRPSVSVAAVSSHFA